MVEKRARVRKEEVGTREYTVNLHKHLHGCTLRRRLQRQSRKSEVCPKRIRVCIARKRNDDEDAKEEFCSLVTVADLPPEECKGLGTKVIDEEH